MVRDLPSDTLRITSLPNHSLFGWSACLYLGVLRSVDVARTRHHRLTQVTGAHLSMTDSAVGLVSSILESKLSMNAEYEASLALPDVERADADRTVVAKQELQRLQELHDHLDEDRSGAGTGNTSPPGLLDGKRVIIRGELHF